MTLPVSRTGINSRERVPGGLVVPSASSCSSGRGIARYIQLANASFERQAVGPRQACAGIRWESLLNRTGNPGEWVM